MTDAELIRAAAEKVMGWTKPTGCYCWYCNQLLVADGEWNPLASDTDAFMLVDKLGERGWEFMLKYIHMRDTNTFGWYAQVGDYLGTGRDPHRRRAIVLAALKAVGVAA